jgi:hypothetical protein
VYFIIEKNKGEKKIQPKLIAIQQQNLVIDHTFESTGYYDVHLYIKDDLIATYSFKVEK